MTGSGGKQVGLDLAVETADGSEPTCDVPVEVAGAGPALGATARLVKRALDLIIGLIGTVASAPILGAAAIAIRLESKGSPVFTQERVGENGRPFKMYKLRTMKVDNDESAHEAYLESLITGQADDHDGLYKLTDDPRVTKVGAALRRYSIDELPQLWNVAQGNMSAVGPRPPLPRETRFYGPADWQRMRAKPGMTGLWQVTGRSSTTFREMIELDIDYWQNWSVGRELKILVKTPAVMLKGDTA